MTELTMDAKAELAALQAVVRWMRPWIEAQVDFHGAILTDEEALAIARAHRAGPSPWLEDF